jgi:hypothetical protein
MTIVHPSPCLDDKSARNAFLLFDRKVESALMLDSEVVPGLNGEVSGVVVEVEVRGALKYGRTLDWMWVRTAEIIVDAFARNETSTNPAHSSVVRRFGRCILRDEFNPVAANEIPRTGTRT